MNYITAKQLVMRRAATRGVRVKDVAFMAKYTIPGFLRELGTAMSFAEGRKKVPYDLWSKINRSLNAGILPRLESPADKRHWRQVAANVKEAQGNPRTTYRHLSQAAMLVRAWKPRVSSRSVQPVKVASPVATLGVLKSLHADAQGFNAKTMSAGEAFQLAKKIRVARRGMGKLPHGVEKNLKEARGHLMLLVKSLHGRNTEVGLTGANVAVAMNLARAVGALSRAVYFQNQAINFMKG